ncbi:hypothetical protein D3C75_1218200 [compost metagenome]
MAILKLAKDGQRHFAQYRQFREGLSQFACRQAVGLVVAMQGFDGQGQKRKAAHIAIRLAALES